MRTRNLLGAVIVAAAGCSGGGDARRTPSPSSATPPPVRAAPGAAYVGLTRDRLPDSITSEGGAVVPEKGGAPSTYSFAHVLTPAGDMVWLDADVPPAKAGGRPRHTVRAVLKIPPLARDERLLMASCDVNGRLDGHIVAIVVGEAQAGRFANVRQAWRADGAAGRFDLIPVAGISCEDPGAGSS